jgi:hypothetical protein
MCEVGESGNFSFGKFFEQLILAMNWAVIAKENTELILTAR